VSFVCVVVVDEPLDAVREQRGLGQDLIGGHVHTKGFASAFQATM
jgi:hypothetical protein